MAPTLDPELRRALGQRIHFYNELGIYDFYRRNSDEYSEPSETVALREEMSESNSITSELSSDPAAALRLIREDIGDCTRCRLHKQGRKQIVFGVGNPQAELMFIGEAPARTKTSRANRLSEGPGSC
jgi:hypothetical protein